MRNKKNMLKKKYREALQENADYLDEITHLNFHINDLNQEMLILYRRLDTSKGGAS